MIVLPITELAIATVLERGVPNKECVALRVDAPCDLGRYFLTVGLEGQNSTAFPLRDNFLWLGELQVYKGDWLFIYTGIGTSFSTPIPNSTNKWYTAFWNRKLTMFSNPSIVAVLGRVDAVDVGSPGGRPTPQLPHG